MTITTKAHSGLDSLGANILQINPFRSVGPLLFGDSRATARAKLNSPYLPFFKAIQSNESDAFDALALHLYYDAAGGLEFVEAFAGAEQTEIEFRGMKFLGRELVEVIKEMKAVGFEASHNVYGAKFAEAGIAIGAPEGTVESVAAYRKGYYDI